MTVAEYRVELDKQKHLSEISKPRLVETPFRSPPLRLFDLGPDEWLLYWRMPDVAPARRRRRVPGLVQPMLFDPSDLARVVGSDTTSVDMFSRSHLQVVSHSTEKQEPKE